MPSGVRDIQLLELKDTISQLNNTISTQSELIRSLQKVLQERDAKDSEKDQLIANLQAQLDYLKNKLFGSTSEIRHDQLPGQLNLFNLPTEDEPEAVSLEAEYIEIKAHKKARKPKATYDEIFADLPTENVYVDTLSEEQKTCVACGTTMASWIIYCAENYFLPIYKYLHRKLLERRFLMADETPIQVLKEKGRRPQSKSYVWLVRSGEDGNIPIILYNYTPTRAGSNAAEFLSGRHLGTIL